MATFSRFLPLAGYLALGAGGSYLLQSNTSAVWARDSNDEKAVIPEHVPTRAQQLAKIRDSTPERPFDILIVGGGATGTGCAVDAVTRGLRTALVEREDFASGTSSKSTKLVHGGVRYLEKAVFQLDIEQLKLVYEALKERKAFLDNAPHLSHPLPIMTPCYHWFEVPYYWAGLKAYDLVAGMRNLQFSKYISPAESLERMPTLAPVAPDGKKLKGTIMYYDGQFDDARMNVALACTAAAAGGVVVNYMECQKLIKNEQGKVIGVKCQDKVSGQEVDVYAKVVVNATGPFADGMRKLSDPSAGNMVTPSSGAHVTLPLFYGSETTGMIIPKTKDGRVVFMLPWLDHIIAGTTDAKCSVTTRPKPTEEEISFILDSISDFLGIKVRRADVRSAWCGIRPLAANPKSKNTENIVREHVIFTDDDGLVTVTGGKWTTYRRMAEETVDHAVASGRLPMNVGKSTTENLKLIGANSYHRTLFAELLQQYPPSNDKVDMDEHVARHLTSAYGDRSMALLQLAEERGLGNRLVKHHPFLEAEVVYCAQNEFAETVEDFIARRTRLAFLDTAACTAAIPRVAELMAGQLSWSSERKNKEIAAAHKYLETFASTTTATATASALTSKAQ